MNISDAKQSSNFQTSVLKFKFDLICIHLAFESQITELLLLKTGTVLLMFLTS